MIKVVTLVLIFTISVYDAFSQMTKYKETLLNCNVDSIKTTNKVAFPRSDDFLYLPNGWTGEFKGELPILVAKRQTESGVFYLRAMNPWNADTREGLDSLIKSWHPIHLNMEIEQTNFLFYYDEKKSTYRLHFHIDESEEYKNRWIWDFYFNLAPNTDNEELLCEIKKIVVQFVRTYKEK